MLNKTQKRMQALIRTPVKKVKKCNGKFRNISLLAVSPLLKTKLGFTTTLGCYSRMVFFNKLHTVIVMSSLTTFKISIKF